MGVKDKTFQDRISVSYDDLVIIQPPKTPDKSKR